MSQPSQPVGRRRRDLVIPASPRPAPPQQPTPQTGAPQVGRGRLVRTVQAEPQPEQPPAGETLDPAMMIDPVAESLEDDTGDPEGYGELVFPGELLTQSITLAIVMPGDDKASYFGSRHIAIVQEGEGYDNVQQRSMLAVAIAVERQIEDALNSFAADDADTTPQL